MTQRVFGYGYRFHLPITSIRQGIEFGAQLLEAEHPSGVANALLSSENEHLNSLVAEDNFLYSARP